MAAAPNLILDLGTTHARLAARGGEVLALASVVAVRAGAVVAVGLDARNMVGRAPEGTRILRAVRGGVVADPEAAAALVGALLREAGVAGLRKPRVLVAVPWGLTESERRAVVGAAKAGGAGAISLVAAPLCAGLGAGLPVGDPVGSMVVDVGGGRAQVAVLSVGGLVVRRSVALGGDDLDAAIAAFFRERHQLELGERTCETLKLRVGTLIPELHHDLRMRVRGRDLTTGRPAEIEVESHELAAALVPGTDHVRSLVLDTLREAPPELAGDIVDRGMIVCGGTSSLRGLDARLRDDTALPVLQAEDPAGAVARGALRLLEDPALFERAAEPA